MKRSLALVLLVSALAARAQVSEEAPAEFVVSDIRIEGLQRISEGAVFNSLPVNIGDRIPNRVYNLDPSQVTAIKDFLKAGKPVLACLGPTNEPADRPDQFGGPTGPDGLEDLVRDLGIHLGKQTVLFNVESKSFAERRSGLLISGVNVEVPPVSFERKPGSGRLLAREVAAGGVQVNAVAPGLTDTPQPRGHRTEAQLQAAGALNPMGRIGQTADIVEVVLFLLSDHNTYVTGQTWHVNGGGLVW